MNPRRPHVRQNRQRLFMINTAQRLKQRAAVRDKAAVCSGRRAAVRSRKKAAVSRCMSVATTST